LWVRFHGIFIAVALVITVLVTVYSLGVYLYKYRALLQDVTSAASGDGS